MDFTARTPATPIVGDDDPWAGLAAPVAPAAPPIPVPVPVPVPSDVVTPVIPWDVEVAPVDPPAPGSVPTAVAASPARVSFHPGVADQLAVYVYLLIDARTGRVFHVGRGRGDRCFRHVEAARAVPVGAVPVDAVPVGGGPAGSGDVGAPADKYPGLDRIREAESDGRPVRIEVLRHGLTGPEADLVVAAVDDVLTLGLPTRLGGQRTPAVDLGASLAKRAKIKRSHPVVLLRVGPHGSDTAYDRSRHGWRIGRRWVDSGSVRSPRWAVLVAGDLVDAVYRIDGWESTSPSGPPGGVERWSFAGERDADLESRYVGRSVAAYLGTGTPSQVTYVWCGPHWVNTAQ